MPSALQDQLNSSHASVFASLPADVLGKCLDTWDPDLEVLWQRPVQRGRLRLVCKRWSRIIEREDDTFAVLSDVRQIEKLLGRFHAKPERAPRLARVCARFPKQSKAINTYLSALTRLLTDANKIVYLAILLFDDSVKVPEDRFERFLTAIEGLRSLQSLAIMPNEYRSYRPVKAIPLHSFVAFVSQPELRRLDVCYLPTGRSVPIGEEPSPKLRIVHTAASGMGRHLIASGSPPNNSAVEEWLFSPSLLSQRTSCGIISIEPFLQYAREQPSLFANLTTLRLEFADLPRLGEHSIKLPSLINLQLDGLQEDHNFTPILLYNLEVVEFFHECAVDTNERKMGRNISLKQQFTEDVLDNLKELPASTFPFRLFVLRCAHFCGALDRLDEAERVCEKGGSRFERRFGMQIGWALI